MNEKIKKRVLECGYRFVIAAVIFLSIMALHYFFPGVSEKISVVWTKNTDLKKTGELLIKIIKEISP